MDAVKYSIAHSKISQISNPLAGQPASPAATAALLPYRFRLASILAEYGHIDAASQHCVAVAASLNTFGGRLPPSLLLLRALANELQLRLQAHAQVQTLKSSWRFCLLSHPSGDADHLPSNSSCWTVTWNSQHVLDAKTPHICVGVMIHS